jgi:hypothetical protein
MSAAAEKLAAQSMHSPAKRKADEDDDEAEEDEQPMADGGEARTKRSRGTKHVAASVDSSIACPRYIRPTLRPAGVIILIFAAAAPEECEDGHLLSRLPLPSPREVER